MSESVLIAIIYALGTSIAGIGVSVSAILKHRRWKYEKKREMESYKNIGVIVPEEYRDNV